MSFKVVKAQHVLAVDDFEAAVTYFTEKLGFTEYNRVGGWSFMQLENFWLMVGDCRGEVPARETGNHSWFAYVNCEGIDDQSKSRSPTNHGACESSSWRHRRATASSSVRRYARLQC